MRPLVVAIKGKMHSVFNENPRLNSIKLIRDVNCGINGILLLIKTFSLT